MPPQPLRVTVWNEFIHERTNAAVRDIYPQGIYAVVAEALKRHLGDAVEIRVATLKDPEHGLSNESLLRPK